MKLQLAHSIMSLHLRYRIWIAELNFDINILRIFENYMQELIHKNNEPEVAYGIDNFEKRFLISRNNIDELRHEMHILKMKLAEYSREGKQLDHKTYKTDHHTGLKKQYIHFRRSFDELKTEFTDFEGRWLN